MLQYTLQVLAILSLLPILLSLAVAANIEYDESHNVTHKAKNLGLPFNVKRIPSNWYISHVRRQDARFPQTVSSPLPLQSVVVLSRPFSALVELPLTNQTQLGNISKTLDGVIKSTKLYLQVRLLPLDQESHKERVYSILVDRSSFNISVDQSALRFYYDSIHSQYTLVYSNCTFFCPVKPFRRRALAGRVFRFDVNLQSILPLLLSNLDDIVGIRLLAVNLHKRTAFMRQRLLGHLKNKPRRAARVCFTPWIAVSALESDALEVVRPRAPLAHTAVLMPDNYSPKAEVWDYLTDQLAKRRDNETVNFVTLASFCGIPNEARRNAWYVMSQAHLYRRLYESQQGSGLFRRLVNEGVSFLKNYTRAESREDYLRSMRPKVLEATSSAQLLVDVPRFPNPDPKVNNFSSRSTQMLYFRVAMAYNLLNRNDSYGQEFRCYIWPIAQFNSNAEDVFYIFVSVMDSGSSLMRGHILASQTKLVLSDEAGISAMLRNFTDYLGRVGQAALLQPLEEQLESQYENAVGFFVFNLLANFFGNVLTPSQQYRVMDALILRTVSPYSVVVVAFEILISALEDDETSPQQTADDILEMFFAEGLFQRYLLNHAVDDPDDLLMERIQRVAERVSPAM